MNASSINPFFHDIDMSTTTGIKTFNNAIIGLDDKYKYDGIQDSIMKHLQAGKYKGAKYGCSNNVDLIETTPGVHLLVYDYPGLITKQMIETASQAIWTIVNDANIQHCIHTNIMYLFHHTSITDKAWNAIKITRTTGKKTSAEMDQHSLGTCIMLQKEQRAQSSTLSEK